MQKIRTYLIDNKPYLLLLLITLIAYWPLSLNVFSLKNDALVYYLPYRYHVSEAIQNGSFPWWNPYLYTGLPLHSDIQSGVWNPVVMLVSLFTTYNMTVLQWELLFYLFAGAAGLYKLLREFNNGSIASFAAAAAYVCCGFMTDSGSLILWIANAAYLPFVFLFFFRILNKPDLRTALKFALALTLLLTTGYPSFIIYSSYLMLGGLLAWLIVHYRQKEKIRLLLKYLAISAIVFLLISAPAILSWWDFLDYYERGSGTNVGRALTNAFPLFSNISYLLPSAVSKDHPWLATDRSARNASIGIFMFIFFIIALTKKPSPFQWFILTATIFSFLFSLGDATPVRKLCHRFLPLMDTFRHPASIRIFTTIGILLIATPALNRFFFDPDPEKSRLKKITIAFAILLFCLLVYFGFQSDFSSFSQSGFNKSLLDSISFSSLATIQALVQLIFVLLLLGALAGNKYRLMPALIVLNAIVFCWMALPFTVISKVKTTAINRYIASFPKGYPLPDNAKPIGAALTENASTISKFGPEKFYNKSISIQDHIITPTINKNYINFLDDKKLRLVVNDYPFSYFSDSSLYSLTTVPDTGRIVLFDSLGRSRHLLAHTKGNIRVTVLSNNEIRFEIDALSRGMFNLFQQYHHGWKAFIDKNEVHVFRSNKAFISLPVPAGHHFVRLKFEPSKFVIIALYVSIGTLVTWLIACAFRIAKNVAQKDAKS